MAEVLEAFKGFLSFLMYMVPGFIAIGFVIYLHEIGHYIVARILGINVEVLGYGFGPTIWSHQGKNTEFRISLIPFGGYCRLTGADDLTIALRKGDDEIKHTEYGSVFSMSPWKKLLIYAAGPLMNLLLALVFLSIVSAVPVERVSDKAILTPVSAYSELYGTDVKQNGIEKGDIALSSGSYTFLDYQDFTAFLSAHNGETIPLAVERRGETVSTVLEPIVMEESIVYGLGNLKETVIGRSESELFLPGDRIIRVNGIDVEYNLDIYAIPGPEYSITLLRDGKELEYTLEDGSFPFAWESQLRVSPDSKTPIEEGWKRTKTLVATTAKAIGKLLSFRLNEALESISGPFSSAATIGEITTVAFKTSSSSGLRTLLYLLSIVSVSIFVGNLIPIPTFDGGQMLVTVFEIFRGKTLKPKTYMTIHITGLVIAYSIIVVMNTYRPIMNLLGL